MPEIKCSVVIPCRNDGYGGNYSERFNSCLESIKLGIAQVRYNVEIILVEWNPPADKPPIQSIISTSESFDHSVKIVTVPNSVHESLPNKRNLAFLEYWAKNVGIRRSLGEYVLVINSDVILSPTIFTQIIPDAVESAYYRCFRQDIRPSIFSAEKILSGDQELVRRESVVTWQSRSLIKNFKLFPFRRWIKMMILRNGPDHALSPGVLINHLLPVQIFPKWAHRVVDGLEVTEVRNENQLATGASGDFLLMHRDNWNDLMGYPELGFNAGCDNYMLCKAGQLGLDQGLLDIPHAIYHPDHGRPFDREPRVIAHEDIFNNGPNVEYDGLFNDDWGLKNVELPDKNFEIS